MGILETRGRKRAITAVGGVLSIVLIAGIAIVFPIYRAPQSETLLEEISPHVFIALGDSVSSGYGLPGYPASPEGGHTSLLFAKLEREGHVDEYHNFATSGFTTTDLLEMLRDMDDEELLLFGNANVVSLNIGGNNILSPFLEYLAALQIVYGTGNIRTGAGGVLSGAWGVIYEIMSGAGNAAPDSEGAGVLTGIGDILLGIGALIDGAREVIAGSRDAVATWRGSLSPELEAALEDGVRSFYEEFREIIVWLEANAASATVIVNTIYNPIPQDILRMSVPISNWAGVLIASMNQAIFDKSGPKGFLVADIGYHFSGQTDLTGFNLNPLAGTLSLDIVHPNAEGHELIAQLNYAAFVDGLVR